MDAVGRFAGAALLLALIAAVIAVTRLALAARTRRTMTRLNTASVPPANDATARILYFTSERCVQCRTRQSPALDELARAAPEPVQIETYDAARDRAVASAYSILTAPSTVVMHADGRVVAINHGFTPADRLATQLGWSPAR